MLNLPLAKPAILLFPILGLHLGLQGVLVAVVVEAGVGVSGVVAVGVLISIGAYGPLADTTSLD